MSERLKHLYVDDQLHKKVKIAAAKKGIKIQEYVKKALEKSFLE